MTDPIASVTVPHTTVPLNLAPEAFPSKLETPLHQRGVDNCHANSLPDCLKGHSTWQIALYPYRFFAAELPCPELPVRPRPQRDRCPTVSICGTERQFLALSHIFGTGTTAPVEYCALPQQEHISALAPMPPKHRKCYLCTAQLFAFHRANGLIEEQRERAITLLTLPSSPSSIPS